MCRCLVLVACGVDSLCAVHSSLPFPDCSFDLRPGGSLSTLDRCIHIDVFLLYSSLVEAILEHLFANRLSWHCKQWNHRSTVLFILNWICPASGHVSMKLSSDGKPALICWPFLKIVSIVFLSFIELISDFIILRIQIYYTPTFSILSHFYCLCVTYIYTHIYVYEK